MNKIPNGGFPPLKFKKTLEKQNNKDRLFSKPIQKNINIRQILINNSKKDIINENIDKVELDEVNNL
tara:strand:+ start:1331 stop:1531 length:201 start_codon:yes stop_codon:yes gene_type:complete